MYSIIQKYTEEGLTSRDDWGSWWDGAFQELVDTHFGNGESGAMPYCARARR